MEFQDLVRYDLVFLLRKLETIRYLSITCLSTTVFHSLFVPCLMLQEDKFPTFKSLSFHLAINLWDPACSDFPCFLIISIISLFFSTDARNYGCGRSHQT